jgi:hypothetical protein
MSTFDKKQTRKKKKESLMKERMKAENDALNNSGSIFSILHGLVLVVSAISLWFISKDIVITYTVLVASLIAAKYPLDNLKTRALNRKIIKYSGWTLTIIGFMYFALGGLVASCAAAATAFSFLVTLSLHQRIETENSQN